MRRASLRHWLDPAASPLPLWILGAFAAYFAACYLFIAWLALDYPYLMEWLEGTTMQIVERAAHGDPIYTEPSVAYTPFMYTPLYYYVAAFFTWPLGIDFPAGRLVSLLSTFGCCFIIYRWMRHEQLGRGFAFAAACMFVALNAAVSGWMHIARVDMLFMFLLLAGLYSYWRLDGLRGAAAASVLFTLAVFTKQQALVVVVTVLCFTIAAWPRKALATAVPFGLMCAAWFAYYQWVSDGWFVSYVYDMPRTQPIDDRIFWKYWKNDIYKVLPVMLAMAVLCVVCRLAEDWRRGIFYLGMLAGMLGASLGSRMHVLGWFNVLLPAYAALVIAGGAGAAALIRARLMHPNVCAVLLCIQFLLLFYTPYQIVPDSRQREITRKYFEHIAAIPGEVLMPDLQFVQKKFGKTDYSYRMNAVDVVRTDWGDDKNYVKDMLREELHSMLRTRYFSAIILPRQGDLGMKEPYYRYVGKILDNRDAPFINGAMQYPNHVYMPVQPDYR